MGYEHILVEQRDRVGVITLNHPERLNAWSAPMEAEMRQAATAFDADPGVGAIVFTGAGRAYCAGADITGFAEGIKHGREPSNREPVNWTRFLLGLGTPTIAAVNGVAVGMGVSTMLPMDLRVASSAAQFGLFFVKVGVVPELGSSYYLAQLVGLGRALEWCLTSRLVGADEAGAAGLVSEVVAPERLVDRAVEIGNVIARQPTPQVGFTRELFRRNADRGDDIDAVMRLEGELLDRAFATWQHQEAVDAFFAKRQPDFTREPS